MTATAIGRDWLGDFVATTRASVLERWDASSCIASTRVGLEVLRYFGVQVAAVPVRMWAFTPDAYAWHLVHGFTDVAPVGWAVGVAGTGARRGTRWDGHLVIHAADLGHILDLSLDQMSRPERGLTLRPAAVAASPGWGADGSRTLSKDTDTGAMLIYEATSDHGYRRTPDWNGHGRLARDAAAEAITALRGRS